MYLPRRRSDSMRRPATPSTNSSGSGWRTIVGKRSSQRTIVRPTRCGLRSAAMVSTSGSSGTSGADDRELLHVGPVGPDLRLDLDAGLELVGTGHHPGHRLGESFDL